MNALSRTKNRVKQLVYAGLRTPRREQALIFTVARLPARLQGTFRKLVPQPHSYAASDVRSVTRYGMRWRLHPAEYFQWHQYYGFADAVLDTLSRISCRDDFVCDIGANIGFYSAVVAQKVGVGGRVFSFEPSPKTYQRLVAHVRDNALGNVHCYDVALGDTELALKLHDFGGTDSGKSSLRSAALEQNLKAVDVSVRSLDSMLAQLAAPRIDVIKIDVEGYEPEVLLGASQTIRASKPIMCVEWSPGWHGGREHTAKRALELLKSVGYRCFGISCLPDTHAALFPLEWNELHSTYNLLLAPPGDDSRLRDLHILRS